MNGKKKNFPLSLSSVVLDPRDTGSRNGARAGAAGGRTSHASDTVQPSYGMRVATPQTATQNAARNFTPAKSWAPVPPPLPNEVSAVQAPGEERANPLVSEAVRRAMVNRVARQGVKDELVLAAMMAVQRHLFMDSGLASQAYIDASLPIGHHQTISQPYIVARMIEVLRGGRDLQRVLEIGTGCGYQAAVLSCLAQEVYSIERIKPLHELAKTNLRPMRIGNIRLQYGDGMLGLPQAAPFDGIILAAAGLEVPPGLLQQLQIGGRLVAPVGDSRQVLQLIERVSQSEWRSSTLEDCHFVPLKAGVV
jgi:protein-L-isoaspartate(D-aspartate) O-methyltransferase